MDSVSFSATVTMVLENGIVIAVDDLNKVLFLGKEQLSGVTPDTFQVGEQIAVQESGLVGSEEYILCLSAVQNGTEDSAPAVPQGNLKVDAPIGLLDDQNEKDFAQTSALRVTVPIKSALLDTQCNAIRSKGHSAFQTAKELISSISAQAEKYRSVFLREYEESTGLMFWLVTSDIFELIRDSKRGLANRRVYLSFDVAISGYNVTVRYTVPKEDRENTSSFVFFDANYQMTPQNDTDLIAYSWALAACAQECIKRYAESKRSINGEINIDNGCVIPANASISVEIKDLTDDSFSILYDEIDENFADNPSACLSFDMLQAMQAYVCKQLETSYTDYCSRKYNQGMKKKKEGLASGTDHGPELLKTACYCFQDVIHYLDSEKQLHECEDAFEKLRKKRIYAAKDKKKPVDLSKVFVQMKISVITDSKDMDEIVPEISKYANTQNKVQTADFSANDPYHRTLESLSRTIWTPAVNGAKPVNWFYERARGQYADALSGESTTLRRTQYKASHPCFTKTDIAKYEMTWDQMPYHVSEGAQKNFQKFTILLEERKIKPDEAYYHALIAKAILFRCTEKIVSDQKYGGYRANIVTYTLAYLSFKTAQRIDLERIWREQAVTPALEGAIADVSHFVHDMVINAPLGANIGEWCKKPKCWDAIREYDYHLPAGLTAELISVARTSTARATPVSSIHSVTEDEQKLIDTASAIPAKTWYALSRWAKETQNFQAWQRGIIFSVGTIISRGKKPSFKQAKQAMIVYEEAISKGFVSDPTE